MRKTRTYITASLGLLIVIGVLATSAEMAIPNSVWAANFNQIPFGSPFEESALDAHIGEEWSDVVPTLVRLGTYAADLYVKQDETYLYVGIALHTGRRLGKIIAAYVYFDDGNFRPYSRGDDFMMIRSGNEVASDADYYYVDENEIKFDRRGGGHADALGIGRFDETAGAYVFEFRKEMDSGDVRDLPLSIGAPIAMIFGIEMDE